MVGLIGLIVYGFAFIDFAGCSWCGVDVDSVSYCGFGCFGVCIVVGGCLLVSVGYLRLLFAMWLLLYYVCFSV